MSIAALWCGTIISTKSLSTSCDGSICIAAIILVMAVFIAEMNVASEDWLLAGSTAAATKTIDRAQPKMPSWIGAPLTATVPNSSGDRYQTCSASALLPSFFT
jgi:hypothetical protein